MGLVDKLYKLFDNKATMHLRVKTFLWYYRILHTTFGGLTIDSKDKLSINKYWKAYGLAFGLVIGVWNCTSLHFFSKTKIMTELYNSPFVATYYLFMTLKALVEIRCIIIFCFLQTHGIKFFKMFYIYRIETSKALCRLFCIWIAHILVPLLIGVYQLWQTNNDSTDDEGISLSKVFFLLIQGFLNYSISWSISFLMWNISIVSYESMRRIEKSLIKLESNHKNDKLFQVNAHMSQAVKTVNLKSVVSTSRPTFFDIKHHIRLLDRSLSLSVVVDFFVTMVVIMAQIYVFAQNNPLVRQFAALLIFHTGSEITRLVINCVANGLVYDQCDKIMSILDNINPCVFDEQTYREFVAFKSMSRDIHFGFTIGGFAPLRRTTLLSIFSFLMNYTVILIQTAKYI